MKTTFYSLPSTVFRVLGIETSCDETAVALLECTAPKAHPCPSGRLAPLAEKIRDERIHVMKNFVSSQIPIHQKYGGVVPEVAARSHVPEMVSLLTTRAVKTISPTPFDVIAVTRGPGLATALRVGVESARLLAGLTGKPLVGINHLEGHLASAWLNAGNRKHWKFPMLTLSVSGGHTELILMKDFCRYKIVGRTRDDAAGEAFDKTAKLMGLPYPGGPEIARLAKGGNPAAFDFPRPMIHDPSFDMSFSGLKTAVRNAWENLPKKLASKKLPADFAASLEQAIVDVLVEKTVRAAKRFRVKGVALVGGVSANQKLRRRMSTSIRHELPGVMFLPSDRKYITDNAAMIAAAGYWRYRKGERHDWKRMDADPEWDIA